MLHVGGWYDIFLAGTFENFVELRKLKKAPQRAARRPVDAPRQHAPVCRRRLVRRRGDDRRLRRRLAPALVRPLPEGEGDRRRDAKRRCACSSWAPATAARTPTGGSFHGGYWRERDTWPLAGTRMVPYYFHADGSLSTAKPRERASSHDVHVRPAASGADDRRRRRRRGSRTAPTTSVRTRASRRRAPPYLPLSARSDVVVFQTEPLAEDVEVIGPIEVDAVRVVDRAPTRTSPRSSSTSIRRARTGRPGST